MILWIPAEALTFKQGSGDHQVPLVFKLHSKVIHGDDSNYSYLCMTSGSLITTGAFLIKLKVAMRILITGIHHPIMYTQVHSHVKTHLVCQLLPGFPFHFSMSSAPAYSPLLKSSHHAIQDCTLTFDEKTTGTASSSY